MTSPNPDAPVAERIDLKPCPFCGFNDKVVFDCNGYGAWYFICDGCGAECNDLESKDAAIEKWNTRATPSPALPDAETINAAARKIAKAFMPPSLFDIQGMPCFDLNDWAKAKTLAAEILSTPPAPAKDGWTQDRLRQLVDMVWNNVTESQQVPSTKLADKLIARAMASPLPPPPEVKL